MANFLAFVCDQNLVECNNEKKTGCSKVISWSDDDAVIGSKYNDPNLSHVYKLSTAYVVEATAYVVEVL